MWDLALAAVVVLASPPQAPPLLGRVLDPHGVGLANAAVVAMVGDDAVAQGRTDGLGEFLLPATVPADARLVATAADGSRGAMVRDAVGPEGFVHIGVVPTRALRGSVHTAAGQPLAGALVMTVPLGGASLAPLGQWQRVGADGSFAIGGVPCGPQAVRVWHPEHAGASATVDGDADATCALRMADVAPSLWRVEPRELTAAHAAVARLLVQARAEDGTGFLLPPELAAMPLLADGTFALPGWPDVPDWIELQVDVPSAVADPSNFKIRGGTTRLTKWCDVAAGPAAILSGCLASNEPLPADGVQLAMGIGTRWYPVRTDAEGNFVSPFTLTNYTDVRLVSRDPRWVLVNDDLIERLHRDDVVSLFHRHRVGSTMTVAGRPAAVARGRVRQQNGDAAAGVVVRVITWHPVSGFSTTDGSRDRHAEKHAVAVSNADGSFEIAGLDPSTLSRAQLQINGAAGILDVAVPALVVGPNDLGELTLQAPFTLRGRVEDGTGKPVPGGLVELREHGGSGRCWIVGADRDGRFTVRDANPDGLRLRRVGARQSQLVSEVLGVAAELVVH